MKKSYSIFAILLVFSLLLSACVTAAPAPEEPVVEEPAAEEPVAEEPAEEPVAEEAPAAEEPAIEEEAMGEVLKIGQLGMLSGSMALYGEQQVRGFALGLEYASGGKQDEEGRWVIAGRPVEVIGRDTEGNPEKGVQLALELIEKEGVELIQGPVSSAVAAGIDHSCQKRTRSS